MSTFALLKNSAIMIAKEPSYGVVPTMDNRSLAIEASGTPEFNANYDTIERDIVRKAFSSYAPLRGLLNTSGTIAVEMHGSGTLGVVPESDVLYECAMGYKLTGSSTTITTLDSTLDYETGGAVSGATKLYKYTFTVADATIFKKGRTVMVYNGTAVRGFGYVVGNTGTALVIVSNENFSSAVVDSSDMVTEGMVYSLTDASGVAADLPSFTANFYRGNITKEQYIGNIVTGLTLNMDSGQIVVPSFTFEGKDVAYTSTTFEADVPNGTLLYDSESTTPLIARSADLIMYDNNNNHFYMPVSSFNVSLENTVNKLQAVTETGYFNVSRTARKVSGSMTTYYQNKDFQDAFLNENTYSLGMILGGEVGNTFAISMPKLKLSEISMSVDSGMFQYSGNFTCEPVAGDDELIIQVF